MLSAVGMKRAACVVALGAALSVGCSRWLPPKAHDVPTQVDPQASYEAVLQFAASEDYKVVAKDDAAKTARLQSHSDDESFIDVRVVGSQVTLTAAGGLVKDGKVHRSLSRELTGFEEDLKERLADGPAPAASAAAVADVAPAPAADGAGVPVAWSEPAYDPSVWGNGNFTCLPVRVPAEHQSALTLQLSNGEKADLQLSLAYAPELCRSPTQCKQAGGCPALGIGDTERVTRIAARLSKGEIGAQATLLDGGKPVANVDLAHHGSVVQAMSEIKH